MDFDCSSYWSYILVTFTQIVSQIGRKTYYDLNSLLPLRNQFKNKKVISIQGA